MSEICNDSFHEDGCPGAAGGDHVLRKPDEVWCAQCIEVAVFAVRMPYGIEALCAAHGLQLAQDATAYRARQPDTRWCALRGRSVPEAECVASCPAPEQRAVCALEPLTGIEQYQAEGR